jgi:parallel beta-helix repeat protein
MKRVEVWCAAVLVCALPFVAEAGTRLVAQTGADGPNCGVDAATACRSISRAIAIANVGDTILVGPGRYGDLNMNGILGDIPGEETGSPGCSCVLSMNKNLIILSSAGAAMTMIDGSTVDVVQTVVVLSVGGEFGRPRKGFTVTQTRRFDAGLNKFTGHGIGIHAENVKIRGNKVVHIAENATTGTGIFTVNAATIIIEGNRVSNWRIGIEVRVAGDVTVRKNEAIDNVVGIEATGGIVVANLATANGTGFHLRGGATVTSNAAFKNHAFGFTVASDFAGTISKNNMIGNKPLGAFGCGLINQHIVELNATNNYWGTDDGPGLPPADQVCDSRNQPGVGTTRTTPFATQPFRLQILTP